MRLRHILLLAAFLGSPPGVIAQTSNDLFDDSALHEIRLTMKAPDWQALKDHYLDNTYYTVDSFQWKGPGGLTASVTNMGIRSRGKGSRTPIKPSLKLDFNHNVKGQTFLGLTSIALKSNSQDGSQIHERMSMLLFRRMGLVAPREASTRLFINGEYIGHYLLVEDITQDFLTRVFNENNGYLYEYTPGDWAGPGLGYHFEYLGQDLSKYSDANNPTPFDPQTHTNAPDTVTLEGMIRTINQASDADFLSAMAPYLDLKLFLTHVAVETYVSDFDCILGSAWGMNNFFLYRFENKKLSQFIAWDKDGAFSPWPPDGGSKPIMLFTDVNVLTRRLMAIPEYQNAYFEALVKAAILAGGAGGWMEREAVRAYNQIKDAVYQDPNKTRETDGIFYPISNDEFDSYAQFVIGFPHYRTAFVLSSVADMGYQLPSNYPSIGQGAVSSATGAIPAAAGSLASVYGANLGSSSSDTVSLFINGYQAPLTFLSSAQLNFQMPWEAGGNPNVGVIVNGAPSNVTTANVAAYSPGVFATEHLDGSVVTADNPAAANEVLTIYATGLGLVSGDMITGQPASLTTYQPTTQGVTATIGGVSAPVFFTGLTPGFLGLYQVNVTVPPAAPSGAQTKLVVSIGGQSSPPVALPVK